MRTQTLFVSSLLTLLCASCAIGRSQDGASGTDSDATSSANNSATTQNGGANTTGGVSDGSALTPGGTQDPNDPIAAVPNVLTNYTTIGRFYAANANVLKFALPSSQIGGRFTGTSLAVRLSDTGYDYFDVVLDGNVLIAPNIETTAGCTLLALAQVQNPNATATTGCVRSIPATTAQTYTIATNLAPGVHTAWLIKRTEMYQGSGTSAVGQTSFYGFVLEPNATLVTPPKANTRHIDFIGDSGFSGYGAGQLTHDSTDSCVFTAANEDAAASVPYLTGQLLHADAVNISASGQGVVNGVYDTNAGHLLPVLYEEILPPATTPAYAFTTQADVVVIAGGGDDLQGASGSGTFADPNAFVAGYAAWLKKIRAHYPNALLICALTSGAQAADIKTLGDAIERAMQMRVAAGDTKIVYYSFFMNETSFTTYGDIASKCSFYYGCKDHPSPAGAAWLAGRLAAFIKTQMSWTD